MTETFPNVTVIIPTYRDGGKAVEAISSVIAQTYCHWKAIVVDDGSSKEEQHRLKTSIAGLDDPRVSLYLSAKNRGVARSRNLGLRLANTDFVAFLDADDMWLPEKLAIQIKAIMTEHAALCCTAYSNVDGSTEQTQVRSPSRRPEYAQLLSNNSIGCSTVVLNRAMTGRVYFPHIRLRQDFALWLRILREGNSAIGLEQALVIRRLNRNSASANKFRAAAYTWRVYTKIENLPLWRSLISFWGYATNGISQRL